MNCGFCGEDSENYELCKSCYYDFKDGLIDKCKVCGKFKSEEYDLCKECYNQENKTGLSKRKRRYPANMIKGRIAEALIEELFLYSGYNVFRYGMENTVPGIMKLLRGVRGDVAMNIRNMPDLVIQNPKTNEVFFVEVKFRKDEVFSIKELHQEHQDYPFKNAYFIIVSKRHIKCITYQELRNGCLITPQDGAYLGDRAEFGLDKEVIIDFCNFAVKFFENA